MHPILIIPGYGDSGPGHWQSLWEANVKYAKRVEMPNWLFPHRAAWVEALDEAIRDAGALAPPVLVAHSLGCIAVAHWVRYGQRTVHGALLVAPPDLERPERWTVTDLERADLVAATRDFLPVPRSGLPFPSQVVASSDDPYGSLERARELAEAWGSQFRDVGPCGHLNTAAGFGEWPRGEAFLQELL